MSNVFARGLRKQKLFTLARYIESRMMFGLNTSRQMAEYLYVDSEGRVNFDNNRDNSKAELDTTIIAGTNIPEDLQSWTISAAIRINGEFSKVTKKETGWRKKLTKECNSTRQNIVNESSPKFYIDTLEGRRREKLFINSLGIDDQH
jgi:hypothetical protein